MIFTLLLLASLIVLVPLAGRALAKRSRELADGDKPVISVSIHNGTNIR